MGCTRQLVMTYAISFEISSCLLFLIGIQLNFGLIILVQGWIHTRNKSGYYRHVVQVQKPTKRFYPFLTITDRPII
jgi:hypothetical protein